LDAQVLNDWIDFCEDRKRFDRRHFARMFMGLYVEPLSDKDIADLRTVFRYVPNSSRVLEKMIRMDGRAEYKTDDQIVELVRRDLREKRKLIDSQKVVDVIDSGAIALTADEHRFDEARSSDANGQFLHCLAQFFMRTLAHREERIQMLSNAFYGLASNLQLQDALTADLLALDVCFDNYFELYLIGVDYAAAEDEVVVMNYRAAA
jgi:hypothetical protein